MKKRACEPVLIRSRLCAGLCHSVAYTGIMLSKNNIPVKHESICAACGAEKYVNRTISIMCKKTNRFGKIKYWLIWKVVKIIEKCACLRFTCPKIPDS